MARPRCATTGKDKYPNRLEAQLALANQALNAAHHRKQKYREIAVRTFWCADCGGWHMTSEGRRNVSC